MENAGDGNSYRNKVEREKEDLKDLDPSMEEEDVPKCDGEETEMRLKRLKRMAEDHKILGDEERETRKKIQKLEAEDAYEDPFDLPDNDFDENLEDELKDYDISDFDDGERIGDSDARSNFTRQKVSEVKVIPEECKVELNIKEEEYYLSDFFKRAPLGHRCPTREEEALLRKACRESQGFDIPLIPGVVDMGGPFRMNLTVPDAAAQAARVSKLALEWYNMDKGTDYALQRIVKSMGRPCAFMVLCITFLAKDSRAPRDLVVTFEARVWVKFKYDIHIMMCRKKGDHDPPRCISHLDIEDEDEDEDEDDDDDDDDDGDGDGDPPQPQPQEGGDQPQPQVGESS